MIALESTIEGKQYKAKELQSVLESLGYTLGGNWDYDHGYYDYKISSDNGYTFLRIPVQAVEGELGSKDAVIQVGTLYLLNHVYQQDNDEESLSGVVPAVAEGLVNQFQAPVDKDGEVSDKYRSLAENLVAELEQTLA
ncbi:MULTISPECIES: YugN-like family protein [Shouchella]|uniref:YugN-like family protein n=1 Tax=Shouchella rhizosphaerae TaxID=866786 RepID=A0ABZ2CZA5_9BACI|nr:YugN-like family protein [Shouchella clausii]PAD18782.1 hypothetical protein CHH73_04450 [Shouchella clausii]PAE82817.1 hypothetical protein CHH77_09395 [Shouchella clausii]PAE92036.1 hypothetical protein CHH70_16015 [Shouchella clausii]